MGKIFEYQQALLKIQDSQTVEVFAKELGKSPAVFLKQLKEAGIEKLKVTDTFTLADKHQFLKYLQKSHAPLTKRKKISVVLDPEWNRLIRRVARQDNGAEFDALTYLCEVVFADETVEPKFQKLINLIVAKCVLAGALPLKKIGRPKTDGLDSIGLNAAYQYWKMMDSGETYEVAVRKLSDHFHKSERHIMRLIAKHKKIVGETLEIRDKKRSHNDLMQRFSSENPNAFNKVMITMTPEIPLPDLTLDDGIEHLELLIQTLAANCKQLTKKI